ncbi:hypothetical protein EJ02DRAFT_487903 [Clathrospora elynae]|uniref:NACHT domain-containing protein n=1 Tax=Clathrospora elynae TaxID=706981 RepID=A0A6A5SSV5_9PLEO|nr:hypothetical protein EJ02DRAFT_487903 [Clathrospora elynae]
MVSSKVKERMSWARKRVTKLGEDAAYSLLGILEVHMLLIYGEWLQEALERLEKIVADRHFVNLPIAKGVSFSSHTEEHNARCLPNTRTALLNDINSWAMDKNGTSIFWLSGMAGTGKSTIARTVAQSFAEADQLGGSFFFKKGEGERGNASRFFSTIALDLIAYEPGMLPGVRKALDEDSALSEKALKDQFQKMILQPLLGLLQATPQASARVVVIDALDECERDENIQAILQLLARTQDILPVSIRVLVTSRPELHDLVELAVPLFIYAATVCRYVGTAGGDPEEYLDKVLKYRKATFSHLDRTYLSVLDHLLAAQEDEDKEDWLAKFQELVGSIVILKSPLSIASLARLLKILRRKIRYRLDPLHSVLNIPNDESCPVRLLHLSFREFLVEPHQKARNRFWVDERTTHGKLASQCPELMSNLGGLRQDICNLIRPGFLKTEIPEDTIASNLPHELQYACRNWVSHLELSHNHVDDENAVHVFLRTHLHWLEAMSLLGEVHDCNYLIGKVLAIATLWNTGTWSHKGTLVDQSPVMCVTFSQEGRFIASGSCRKIKVWETSKNVCYATLETLEGHSGKGSSGQGRRPLHIAFSSDGLVIASASGDGSTEVARDDTIRLWDVSAMGLAP